MRKDYTQYQVNDLMEDDYFLHWIRYKDEASTQFWNAWLEQYPQKADVFKQACQLYEFMHLQQEAESTSQDELEVLQSIQQAITAQPKAKSAKVHKLYGTFVRWAAVLILMIGIGFIAYTYLQRQPEHTLVTFQSEEKISRLTLPDGTLIILNEQSSCRYPPHIGEAQTREIWIEGEAFLDVSHQVTKQGSRKSFVVHMHSMDVEVLGTRFNVVNAPNRQNVMLEKGRVRVNQQAQKLILAPGEIAHMVGDRLIKNQINPALYTGWLTGRLQLENTSLEEIIKLLEYKHGYIIDYPQQHSVLQQKMSGSLDIRNQTELLHTLSLAFNIQITHQGKHITISPEKPANN